MNIRQNLRLVKKRLWDTAGGAGDDYPPQKAKKASRCVTVLRLRGLKPGADAVESSLTYVSPTSPEYSDEDIILKVDVCVLRPFKSVGHVSFLQFARALDERAFLVSMERFSFRRTFMIT